MSLICLLSSFFISLNLQHIRSGGLRVGVNTLLGLSLAFYAYGVETCLYILYSMTGYLVMLSMPREKTPYITAAICAFFLTTANLFVQLVNAQGYNVQVLAMITFVKQIQITFNFRDGGADPATLTSREKEYMLKEMPCFVDYCSYMFNLQSQVIGPSFEFADWLAFIRLKAPYDSYPRNYNVRRAFTRLISAFGCIGVSMVIKSFADLNSMLEPGFEDNSLFFKCGFMLLSI